MDLTFFDFVIFSRWFGGLLTVVFFGHRVMKPAGMRLWHQPERLRRAVTRHLRICGFAVATGGVIAGLLLVSIIQDHSQEVFIDGTTDWSSLIEILYSAYGLALTGCFLLGELVVHVFLLGRGLFLRLTRPLHG